MHVFLKVEAYINKQAFEDQIYTFSVYEHAIVHLTII